MAQTAFEFDRNARAGLDGDVFGIEDQILQSSVITKTLDELRVTEANLLREASDRDGEENVDAKAGRTGSAHIVPSGAQCVINMSATTFIGN
jgi:hypothetical protein